MYSSSSVALRQRTYTVCNDVKYAHRLLPIVTRPGASPDGKPRVLWSKFHDTIPVDGSPSGSRARTVGEQGTSTGPGPPSDDVDDEESDATVTITKGMSDLQQQMSTIQRLSQQGKPAVVIGLPVFVVCCAQSSVLPALLWQVTLLLVPTACVTCLPIYMCHV